jgi:hypothetical protein
VDERRYGDRRKYPDEIGRRESLSGYLLAKGKGVLVFFPRRVLFGAALSQVQEAFGFVFQRVDEPRFSEGDLCECIDESRPVSRFRTN